MQSADGEPNESINHFNPQFFWKTLGYISVIKMHFGANLPAGRFGGRTAHVPAILQDGGAQGEDGRTDTGTPEQAFKATSQEATKISLAYSKPPVPSEEVSESTGTTLRKTVREAVADVIEGTMQLIEVILNARIQRYGHSCPARVHRSVWEACDHFSQIPKDNQAAVVVIVSGYLGVVKDALEEMEEALAGGEDPFSDVLDDDDTGARGNQDTYWSEADRRLIAPCLGLMKASKACLKKVLGTLKAHGKGKCDFVVKDGNQGKHR
ncbi:unnamed protein product, partial [Ranitomeya imitator]